MIEIKDIEKLAKLSRIKLTDAEKKGMQSEIEAILAYVDQIKAVSGDSVAEGLVKNTKSAKSEKSDKMTKTTKMTVRNVMREDAKPHESGIHTEAILACAPARQGNYLKVKKIL